MTTDGTAACVLVAAGRGERLGGDRPKAFVELDGHPLVWYAMLALSRTAAVSDVIVVVPAGYEKDVAGLVSTLPSTSSCTFGAVAGGVTRQESVSLGLAALPETVGIVLVHDAARCLTPPGVYDAIAEEVRGRHDAVVPGLAVVDTLKEIDEDGRVAATPERAALRTVQTPQGFRRSLLAGAYDAARSRGDTDATDDASLVERMGRPVYVVAGHEDAFKITRPRDLLMAETVLARDQLDWRWLSKPGVSQ